MIHKFKNKKGNLTVILLGIIFVMILMTIGLSRRMTSHTQLLTLSDYTQISRYFLESYVGEVMQKIRHEVNQPNSLLAKEICKNIEEINTNLTPHLNYSPSDELKALAKSYGNAQNEIKIKNSDFKIELVSNDPDNNDEDIGALTYPDGIYPGDDQKGKEKKGVIQITCKCEFMKREYTLVVQYPFTVVYRMTPILKDFMLFVDNIYEEQCEFDTRFNSSGSRDNNMDTLNILPITDGKLPNNYDNDFGIPPNLNDNNQLTNVKSNLERFRPLVLLDLNDYQDLSYEEAQQSGMVYFGPTDTSLKKSIYLNLAGTSTDDENAPFYNYSDLFVINPQIIGIDENEITKVKFPINNGMYALGTDRGDGYFELANHSLKFGFLGFSKEVSEKMTGNFYKLDDFFGSESDKLKNTFWGEIRDQGESHLKDYLSYASGIKLFGYSIDESYTGQKMQAPPRHVFGNVFGRFLVISLYNFGSGAQPALTYNPGLTIDEYNRLNEDINAEYSYLGGRDSGNTQKYDLDPIIPDTELDKDKYYQKLMSKIMSGLKAYDDNTLKNNYKKDGSGELQYMFMPMNVDYKGNKENKIFDERDFEANDGFKIEISKIKFNDIGSRWFTSENTTTNPINTDEMFSNIEARIGKAFVSDSQKSAQDKFKEAVGYPDKFIINGVVYVGGDLELDDMDLQSGECSGGIVLVDGDITLSNITRGKIGDITLPKVSEYYTKWNKPGDDFIATDSIITFVCLKSPSNPTPKITIKGNVLLGVQLINLSGDEKTNSDQICWDTDSLESQKDILFYGSIVCNKFFLPNRLNEFGKIKRTNVANNDLDIPYFIYPPVMANKEPPLAVQIMENMRSYNLTSNSATTD